MLKNVCKWESALRSFGTAALSDSHGSEIPGRWQLAGQLGYECNK